MISYVTIGADDLEQAVAFYDPVLGALGHARSFKEGGWAGYAPGGEMEKSMIFLCKPFDGNPARAGNGIMIGLQAASREQVDAFHAAALASGGTDEGAPGPRPEGSAQYLAYVRDPLGNKLSAMYRG